MTATSVFLKLAKLTIYVTQNVNSSLRSQFCKMRLFVIFKHRGYDVSLGSIFTTRLFPRFSLSLQGIFAFMQMIPLRFIDFPSLLTLLWRLRVEALLLHKKKPLSQMPLVLLSKVELELQGVSWISDPRILKYEEGKIFFTYLSWV